MRHSVRVAGLAIAAAAFSISADSKCAIARYQVSGLVVDCETKQPLPNVHVILFPDQQGGAWLPDDGRDLITGKDGRFSGQFSYDMYSGPGLLSADRCTRRLKTLSVVVSHEYFVPSRSRIDSGSIPKLDRDLKATLELRAVLLFRQGRACTSQ